MLQKLLTWFKSLFKKEPTPTITTDVYTKVDADTKELETRIAEPLAESRKREEETGIRIGDPIIHMSVPHTDKPAKKKRRRNRKKKAKKA